MTVVSRGPHERDDALEADDRADLIGGVVDGLLGDVRDLKAEVLRLRRALAADASVNQASGILMFCYGIDADAAVRLLQRWSEMTHVELAVIAHAVLDAAGTFAQADREPALASLVRVALDGEPQGLISAEPWTGQAASVRP